MRLEAPRPKAIGEIMTDTTLREAAERLRTAIVDRYSPGPVPTTIRGQLDSFDAALADSGTAEEEIINICEHGVVVSDRSCSQCATADAPWEIKPRTFGFSVTNGRQLLLCNTQKEAREAKRLLGRLVSADAPPEPTSEMVEALGFDDLLRIGELLLERYPENTVVSSGHPNADVGARFTDALRKWIRECRAALAAAPKGGPSHVMD